MMSETSDSGLPEAPIRTTIVTPTSKNRMDRHLADTSSLCTNLREMALDAGRRDEFAAACQAAYTGHNALAEIVEVTAGTRWRFIVTRSGSAIDVRHKDDMYAEFWESVAQVKSAQSAFGKDEYEQEVRGFIDNSFLKHKRTSMFLTEFDNLISFDRAMAIAFEGSGFRYDGRNIVPEDDDTDCEDDL